MKKTLQIFTLLVTMTLLSVAPATVSAQDVTPVEEVPSTGAETAGVPDSGIKPSDNKVLQTVAVFAGGSLLGAGIGLGIISARKKRFNQ